MLRSSVFIRASLFVALILGALMSSPVSARAAAAVYVPPPTGVDDTSNIQTAIDDCMDNYPAGCTVQLSIGTYKSKQLIAEDFHGFLKGAGMGATTLEVLPPLVVTVSTDLVFNIPPSRTNKYPMLLLFTGGDITVSDLTFKVTDPNPTTPWCYSIGCGQTWLEGFVGVVGESANLIVERVAFEGAPGPIDGRNYNNGTFFIGLSNTQPLAGTFKVFSSHFIYGDNGFEVYNVRDAQIVIGGSGAGNVIEQGILGGVVVDLDNSTFEYSYNKVAVNSSYAGLMILQGNAVMPNTASQFVVRHNIFQATGSYVDGIYALDAGPLIGRKTANFLISDNTIRVGGSEMDPAVSGIHFLLTEDAVISNNRISGVNALFGIAAEADTRCMLKGNNVEQLHALFAPIALLTLGDPFFLDTSGCAVVGGNAAANVYDEGTNNSLTGVNMIGNPPGPAVKAAMQQKRELLKSRVH